MPPRMLADLPLAGKNVLLRADFNVPLAAGEVADDFRMQATLPTLHRLLAEAACLLVTSHLGRPGGRVVPELRLDPVAARLATLLDREVHKLDTAVGPEVLEAVSRLPRGSVLVLENTRFYPGETTNDAGFARQLAAPADLFVNDAFGVAHRAHASNVGVAAHLPSAMGLLLARELEVLGRLIRQPEPPFAAVLGGAKVSDKLSLLRRLLERVDLLLVGGAMANTFLRARGVAMGDSLVEAELVETARELLAAAAARGVEVVLPADMVAATAPVAGADARLVTVEEGVAGGYMAVDVGPATCEAFQQALEPARTIFWNGPMGVAEVREFAEGTRAVAAMLAESAAFTVIGGGDSVAAVARVGLLDAVDHVSTGGGASLEYLEGRPLPAVTALEEATR